ncbi:hypothetical protein OF83DRAFT_1166877 [Amylostereum chailletii]|nr:hypothetical protein OF83DRAFT_1166877 [Amylostereum chailletii]
MYTHHSVSAAPAYLITYALHLCLGLTQVDKKVRPVATAFPQSARVKQRFPEDPLASLAPLPVNPPKFVPTERTTMANLAQLKLDATGFLWPEELKLFQHIMVLNEEALTYTDKQWGTLCDNYFTPYKIPTVPHEPLEYKNIPILPGIKDKVIDLLKEKIWCGVYEPSQSSYRSHWFCVVKKDGKLRIVHDLQPLN